jgi:hypothetical protein
MGVITVHQKSAFQIVVAAAHFNDSKMGGQTAIADARS